MDYTWKEFKQLVKNAHSTFVTLWVAEDDHAKFFVSKRELLSQLKDKLEINFDIINKDGYSVQDVAPNEVYSIVVFKLGLNSTTGYEEE